MLYLEDYLEMIENLPNELRYRFTSIRELDLQVHNEKDKLDARINEFFNNSSDLPPEIREREFMLLKQDYNKILEFAEEKIMLANALYELVEKSIRRLDSELHKFKIELEADNAGITEILEKRSLEAENTPIGYQRGEKRKATTQTSTDSGKHNTNNLLNEKSLPSSSHNGFGAPTAGTSGNSSKLQTTNKNNSTDIHHSGSSFDNDGNGLLFLNSKLSTTETKKSLTGTSAIAAAASQAIAATQQMPFGRRTASLKASFDAINSNSSSFSNFPIRLGSTDHADNNNDKSSNRISSNGLDDQDKPKKSRLKRNRLSSQYNLDISNNSSNASDVMPDYNVNEPLYCYCNNVSYGEMIFCENKQCRYQWFHYECVGIKVVPEGSWFCPSCTKKKTNHQSSM